MLYNIPCLSIFLGLIVGSVSTASAAPKNATARATADNFINPVFWEDLADLDLIRVDDTFYYSASTMHYSPGAPILRSFDLINWEFVGHSVPRLEFGSTNYDLPPGAHAYVRGIWASTLKHRASTGTFFWLGCVDFTKTYIYNSPAVEGPWTQVSIIDSCYYDAGMLIDDDDTIYVAFGSTNMQVAQLSPDGLSQVSTQVVFNSPDDVGYIEGSRFYKKGGNYYILVTGPPSKEYVLMSTTGPFGPYSIQPLALDLPSPPLVNGGSPHQGGLIDTPNGDWYYMAFCDAYPGGRVPVLAPVTWSSDGWPSLELVDGAWASSYPYPLPTRLVSSPTGVDTFASLGPNWEWNHNPDDSSWAIDNGLVLRTASVTNDLYAARNTITHRILGPKSSGTILLDVTNMVDGDRAGLAMLRDMSAWIGVKQIGTARQIVMENGLTMGGPSTTPQSWETTGTGKDVATVDFSGTQIWLRATADIQPGGTNSVVFAFSTDEFTFTDLGDTFVMNTDWQFFMGYRFGIFNFATLALGGSVTVKSFEMEVAS